MTSAELAERGGEALALAVKLAAPTMGAATLAGLLTSWVAGTVRAQDATATQLPKLVAGGIAFAASFRWMSDELVAFFQRILGA